jgi:hypothetical protein
LLQTASPHGFFQTGLLIPQEHSRINFSASGGRRFAGISESFSARFLSDGLLFRRNTAASLLTHSQPIRFGGKKSYNER